MDAMDEDMVLEDVDCSNNLEMTPEIAHSRLVRYRSLLDRLEVLKNSEDLGLTTAIEVDSVLKEANQMHEEYSMEIRVKHIDETIMDARVLATSSEIIKECVQAVDVSCYTYEPNEYAAGILRYLEDDEGSPNWLKLIGEARQHLPSLPQYKQIYGAYDINEDVPPTPRPKQRQQRVVQQQAEKKVPETIKNVDAEDEKVGKITDMMLHVLKMKYNENDDAPIRYYDYVVETDFGTTVENTFYFSFLIRDGKASLDLNGRGEPIIAPLDRKELKAFRAEGKTNTSVVHSLNMRRWEQIKKKGYLQQYKRQQ